MMDIVYFEGCWCPDCDQDHAPGSEYCTSCEIAGCTLTESRHD